MENNLSKKSSDDGFDRTLGSFGLSVEFFSVFLSVCLPPILSFSLSHSQDHTLLLHLSGLVPVYSSIPYLSFFTPFFYILQSSSCNYAWLRCVFILHSHLFVECNFWYVSLNFFLIILCLQHLFLSFCLFVRVFL